MGSSKILLITNDFPPYFSGGISNYYYNLTMHTSNLNIKVMAPWSVDAKEYDSSKGLNTLRVMVPISPKVTNRTLQMVLFLITSLVECFRHKIDAVVIGHLYLAPIGYILKLIRGIPYFLIMYGGEHQRYSKGVISSRITRGLVNKSQAIIAISRYAKDAIVRGWGDRKNIHILHPGVSVERYSPDKGDKNHPLNNEDKFILLTVGTLVKRKGHDNVIKALHKIRDKAPNISYLIIGKGPEMDNLKELAYEKLGLGEMVKFLGFMEDEKLVNYYNLCDVFIMPSRKTDDKFGTEGFGIVYLEANACEKPVIGGRSGGVPDAVLDGETGILVDPESVDEIAEAILYLYKNPDVARRLGKNGRKRVEAEFRWEKIADEFERIIRNYI